MTATQTPTPDADTDNDAAAAADQDAELADHDAELADHDAEADTDDDAEAAADDDAEAAADDEAEAVVDRDTDAGVQSDPDDTDRIALSLGQDVSDDAVAAPSGEVSRAHLKGLIEALVFAADHPVSINEVAKAAGKADKKLVRALVDELVAEYAERGVRLEEVAGGLLFRTSPAYAPFVRDVAARKPVRMTRAQLETLAIIAYRQPITRPEVDDIRGVDSGPVLKMLLERDVVRILGKKDEPGRPLLYGTTPYFLEFFGLRNLKDLPTLREFTELSDDSKRLYEREASEIDAEEQAAAQEAAAPVFAREDLEEGPAGTAGGDEG